MRSLLAIAFLFVSTRVFAQERAKPASLLAFEDARARIRATFSGRVYDDEAVPQTFRSTVSGDQVAFFDDGRTNGAPGSLEDGTPLYGLEDAWLRTSDKLWGKPRRVVPGQVFVGAGQQNNGGAFDYRCVGMLPAAGVALLNSPHTILDSVGNLDSIEYRETIDDDGIHIVERRIRDSEEKIVWYIDPNLDWNATRVELVSGDRVVFAAINEYDRKNGLWIPTKTTYDQQGDEVKLVVELEYAQVNTPAIPETLSPELVGFYVGTPVNICGGAPAEQQIWVGDHLATHDEYRKLLLDGAVTPDPRIQQIRDAHEAEIARRTVNGRRPQTTVELYGTPFTPLSDMRRSADPSAGADDRRSNLKKKAAAATQPADEWDSYVVAFIRHYDLPDEQAQKCLALLADAKSRRDAHLGRVRPQIERVANAEPKTPVERKRSEEKLNVLLRPVQECFEHLKRRLAKIPTRQQVEAYGQFDAARPKPVTPATAPAPRP